ncbi:MAG: hypothetical protein IPJ65_43065 [Archangiaceae bacterium]|nr:hypothetical protein [Archangiaceae bacterium]
MSLLSGLKDVAGKAFGGVADLFAKLGPFQMLLGFLPPPFNLIALVPMIANIGKALTQEPPDWGAAITGALMAAVPFGMGKAFQAFKAAGGGTATSFASKFGKSMSEKLDIIKTKVLENGKLSEATKARFTNMIDGAKKKFGSREFEDQVANDLNTATGTRAGEHIRPEQMTDEAAGQMTNRTGTAMANMAPMLTQQMIMQMGKAPGAAPTKDDFKPLTEAQIMAEVNSNLAKFQPLASNAPVTSSRPPTIIP